jgi:nucleoside-diphosphate-sugar epimerase
MSTLVTGASGFIGRAVVGRLAEDGRSVRAASRRTIGAPAASADVVHGIDLAADFDWDPIVAGCDAIVHCAARVHVLNDSATDPLSEFRKVNVAGTLALARTAARAGVRRFVFLSSVKVNGERTAPGRPFTVGDRPAPEDPYGISKHEAEVALRDLSATNGMEIVCVRPALVYGPGVKANFLAMMRAVARGLPLPFGAITNKRSLVGLDNLVDLISICLEHPAAANKTFLVSDGEDLSTTELLRRTGVAIGRPARLIPVPERVLRLGATILRKPDLARRLLGSLQIDITATQDQLGWRPRFSVDEELRATADWFLSGRLASS